MSIGSQIKLYRKKAGKSQTDLALDCGVSTNAVSLWEKDRTLPSADKLAVIAKALGIPESKLTSGMPDGHEPRNTLFSVRKTWEHVMEELRTGQYPMAMAAFRYVDETRKRDLRRDKVTPYIYHPMLMVDEALALGIASDELLTLCFLHDVGKKGISPVDLPKEIPLDLRIKAVSIGQRPGENRSAYLKRMAGDPMFSMVKCLSRVGNITSMAANSTKQQIINCIVETEDHYGALIDSARSIRPWKNAAWILSYQLRSICEAYKYQL